MKRANMVQHHCYDGFCFVFLFVDTEYKQPHQLPRVRCWAYLWLSLIVTLLWRRLKNSLFIQCCGRKEAIVEYLFCSIIPTLTHTVRLANVFKVPLVVCFVNASHKLLCWKMICTTTGTGSEVQHDTI